MAEQPDTIFAPATAVGRAGIAILRISGPRAAAALAAIAGISAEKAVPRRATLARLRDPGTGETLDRGLALWFPGPDSATGEDVAELHLHGSSAVLSAAMAALRLLGLRMAEPGEFTRRAFLNDKLDLLQAEAVADLADAETEAQRRQALRQLSGAQGRVYEGWRVRLTRCLAHLEAVIDFPDEDLPPETEARIAAEIANLAADIQLYLRDGNRGERLRDGIRVAIIGPPNAGKSSLLNRLARREAAITSPVAGTTRDVVEVALDLGGYPVILADTAGLRDSPDPIEREGVRRALAQAADADLRLHVIDATRPEWLGSTEPWEDGETLLVANKSDLQEAMAESPDTIAVSALTGLGIDRLVEEVTARIAARYCDRESLITRARHREALQDVASSLQAAAVARLPELRAEDLRLAWRSLGRITGRTDVEDLLDVIFRDFCIGK